MPASGVQGQMRLRWPRKTRLPLGPGCRFAAPGMWSTTLRSRAFGASIAPHHDGRADMKPPRKFFEPLAIGAPAPVPRAAGAGRADDPFRAARILEKVRAKAAGDGAAGGRPPRQSRGRHSRRRQGGGARRLHRDGAEERIRRHRPMDAHQRAELALGARRHHADRRRGRAKARRDDAAEGRRALGHRLSRPVAGAARGAAWRDASRS